MPASSSRAASGSKRKNVSTNGSANNTAVASGSKTKKAKSSNADSTDASIPLGKALASTEKRIRDGAVRSLTAYLAANGAHTIPDLELQKLWKGLFYCFWMSDKPLIQQRLANDLANLVLIHPHTTSASTSSSTQPTERAMAGLKFLETFWDTLVSEWAGLDKHRIDKYYLLVRRFVAAGFRLLAEEKWHATAVQKFQSILGKFEGGVLTTNNPKVPDSLTYHLSDIYLDELEKVVEQVQDMQNEQDTGNEAEDEEEMLGEDDLPLVPTMDLLMPFVDALATAKSKAMYDRIWNNVFEPLLQDTLRASARGGDDLSEMASDEDDEEDDGNEEQDDEEEEEDDGDETANGTEFHSFVDESDIPLDNDSDSEPSLAPESDSDEEDDEESDVRYPLLLALSSVPTPSTSKDNDEDEDFEANEIDVALVLRKSIFQALFTAASRKDATEARRRLLYQLWRDEQDRLNDLHDEDDEDDE